MKPVLATAATALTIAMAPAVIAACASQPAAPTAAGSTPAASTPAPVLTPTTPASSPSTAPPAGASQVVSSRVAYPWHWPNDAAAPGQVLHTYPMPPVPRLIQISAGRHPAVGTQPSYDRMSFTFSTAFPSYRFEFTDELTGDASGMMMPLNGMGVLRIVFSGAQAHTDDGTRSTIMSQPSRYIGFTRMTDFAQAGDFEGVLTYGIGISWPIPHSNPQFAVRAYEVETVTAAGQHRYTVAVDIDASAPAAPVGD